MRHYFLGGFSVIILVLWLQNLDPIRVQLFLWDAEMSMGILLPLIFFGGALAGWAGPKIWQRRHQKSH